MRRPRNPVPPNTVTVCTVMAQLPTAGELSRERAYQTRACGVMQLRTGYSAAVESHRVCRRAPGSDPRGCGAVLPCRHGSGDRQDMPRIIPVGFCQSPGREHARPNSGFARRLHVRLTCWCQPLAVARDPAWRATSFLLQLQRILDQICRNDLLVAP